MIYYYLMELFKIIGLFLFAIVGLGIGLLFFNSWIIAGITSFCIATMYILGIWFNAGEEQMKCLVIFDDGERRIIGNCDDLIDGIKAEEQLNKNKKVISASIISLT